MTTEQILNFVTEKGWVFACNDENDAAAQTLVAAGKVKNIREIFPTFPWGFTYVKPDCQWQDLGNFFNPQFLSEVGYEFN